MKKKLILKTIETIDRLIDEVQYYTSELSIHLAAEDKAMREKEFNDTDDVVDKAIDIRTKLKKKLKKDKTKRLQVLLYNAITYMIETRMENESLSRKEMCNCIAEYLGSDVKELQKFGVLDYDEIMSNE